MNYTLQIDLLGGERVEAIISRLQGMAGSLGKGGSVFGGGSSGPSPLAEQTDDAARFVRQVQAGTVGVHALGRELKNLGETPGVRIFSKGGSSQGAFNLSPSALARNPHLAAMLGGGEDARMAGGGGQGRGSMKVDLKSAIEKAQIKAQKDAVTFKKDMTFLMKPLFNLGSMWATLFSGRQAYSAMNTDSGKAFLGKYLGGMGAVASTALLVGAATAAGLALKALSVTVKETMAAYEHARQIYGSALTSGLGTQFTVHHSKLAEIMGVSELDVFRFGAQMAYLNPKLDQAVKILAQTAVPLTAVSWEIKVLGTDFSAMFAKIASEAAPAVLGFLNALDALVKKLNSSEKWLKLLLGGGAEAVLNTIFGFTLTSLFTSVGMPIASASGGASMAGMPGPQSWMKQLPASHWERLGLVVMDGGTNYAKDTAKNTREAVAWLKKIALSKPTASPMGTFGMSPLTANP
jgi:hypothetical protein